MENLFCLSGRDPHSTRIDRMPVLLNYNAVLSDMHDIACVALR